MITQQIERDRCWITHRRRAFWNVCPLCGAAIKWVRLWDGTYSPCDEEPVIFAFAEKGKGKYKVVSKREIIENVTLTIESGVKPRYARLPHYYSCPVLRNERRAWAMANR